MRQPILFSILMSIALSSLMTFWVTWINLGLRPDFLSLWGHAFSMAWPAAGLIAFVLGPRVMAISVKVDGWLQARADRCSTPRLQE